MSIAYDRVRTELERLDARIISRRPDRFMAQCPAHPDNNPSLEVIDKGDKVVLACYAGCQTPAVAAMLNMTMADLFDDDLPVEKSRDRRGLLVCSYLYERLDGQPWFYVDRYWPKSFRQRLPDVDPVRSLEDATEHGRLGLKGRAPVLYHAPRVWRAMKRGGAVVYWLDGEKDVETAERHGLVATCPPGFAKWDEHYAEFLRDAERIVMVVDQDKDRPNGQLGAGQANAVEARAGFRSVGLAVDIVAPAAGKDFTDHFEAGHGVDEFRPEPTIYTRPRGMKADVLVATQFPPLAWAVNDVVPAGLTIIAGSPKSGKTWVVLDWSLAVSLGGWALGKLETNQGSVLHLAREDGYRRLQDRIVKLMGRDGVPSALEVIPTDEAWAGGEQGLANMTEWAEEVENPRMVIIDTLAKVEPEMGEEQRRGAYTGNYSMMTRYKTWAETNNVAVVMVHHDNKAKVEPGSDVFSRISGTRGLTGAADTLIFLESKRAEKEGFLHVTGRDVEEQVIAIHRSGPLWVADEPL